MAIKLLVAGGHEVVRAGIKTLLEETDIETVGEATTGNSAMRLINKLRPQVLLLDVHISRINGLNTLARLRLDRPRFPILMYSFDDNPTIVARSYTLNANGYLLIRETTSALIDAIHTVANGSTLWTRQSERRITRTLATPRPQNDGGVPLTLRESEVLRRLTLGLTNKEIASSLKISYETVKEHVQHILRKVGVLDRTQAAVWAVRNNII